MGQEILTSAGIKMLRLSGAEREFFSASVGRYGSAPGRTFAAGGDMWLTGPERTWLEFDASVLSSGAGAEIIDTAGTVCLTEEEGTRSEFITSSRGKFFTSSTG